MLKRKALLKKILTQPSAPFREKHVIELILKTLKDSKIPYFQDPIGNIVLGVSSKTDYLRLVHSSSKEPLRIYIAHMDHPGFHGVKWSSPDTLEVRWHGGSPTQHLKGASVWLADASGYLISSGKITKAKLLKSGRAIDQVQIKIQRKNTFTLTAKELYGGLSFQAPVWQEGNLLYTKAADDLVGSFAVTSLALDLWKKKKHPSRHHFLGLLTRAEEVGFIGAIGHFDLGWLSKSKRPLLCVSLETSRTLPGAEIGKGPVVRLGDKSTVFHAGALKVFSDLANQVLPGRCQRRIMDGGTCEATAATAYGLVSIGISVPLGNYHNQSFEGGPGSRGSLGPAPEFVHLEDIKGLLELCHALLKPNLPWAHPWKETVKAFKKDFQDYLPLLRSGP